MFFKNKIYGQTGFLGGDQKPSYFFSGQKTKWKKKKKIHFVQYVDNSRIDSLEPDTQNTISRR